MKVAGAGRQGQIGSMKVECKSVWLLHSAALLPWLGLRLCCSWPFVPKPSCAVDCEGDGSRDRNDGWLVDAA